MDKFLRNYFLQVQTNTLPIGTGFAPEFISIRTPFTIEFDVKREITGSANPFSIRIYNLAEKTRSRFLKDFWTFSTLDVSRLVKLQAGYGDGPSFPEIIYGNISECYSYREGVNFITTIQGQDGLDAFLNATVDQQYPSGTPYRTIIGGMMQSMKPFGITPGAIGDYPGEIPRAIPVSGQSVHLLSEWTSGGFFVDGGRANALNDNEVIKDSETLIISSDSGLLGTPKREQQILTFDMIFEPKLVPGTKVQLKSTTNKSYNGYARVFSVHHKGMISSAVCGSATTTVVLQYGPKGFSQVNPF